MKFKVRCDTVNADTGDVSFSGRSDEGSDIVIVVSVLYGAAADYWKESNVYGVEIEQ